ncbi:MAG: biopolymer transporter ExbD [Pseudomonadota bacterium]
MPLRYSSRRTRRISMTSLIDVIFLLLLFFMLTSTFTKFAELPLVSAGQGATAPTDQAPVFIRLGSDTVLLNGAAADIQTIAEPLSALVQDAPRTVLITTAGSEVTSQRLVDLLVALAPISGVAVQVLR